jgi:hypothetical protein
VQDTHFSHRAQSSERNPDKPPYDKKQCVILHGIPESIEKFPNDRIIADLDKFQRLSDLICRAV